jgi:hypothetical protein
VCASAVVMLDTPCSEVVWTILATHSIRRFPLHFPSRASPCAITFQLVSTSSMVWPLLRYFRWLGFTQRPEHWLNFRVDQWVSCCQEQRLHSISSRIQLIMGYPPTCGFGAGLPPALLYTWWLITKCYTGPLTAESSKQALRRRDP